MASEMRRIAKALVERHSESFASRYSREESAARLRAALQGFAPTRMRFGTGWREEADGLHLDVEFSPAPRTDGLLKTSSIALTLLVAAALWAFFAADGDPVVKFLVALASALGILAFPLVTVALGSQREAEEAAVRRAIRKALVNEEAK
jgi:hypothetical protein